MYPGQGTSAASSADPAKKGGKARVESAFAHSTFPSKLAGWDATSRGEQSAFPPSTSAQAARHEEAGDQAAGTQETIDLQGVPITFRPPQPAVAAAEGSGEDRLLAWAASQQPQQGYGSSFDNLFALTEPAGLRYGMPQAHSGQPAPTIAVASVGQSAAPFLTVQCGRFSAPVQRDAPPPQAPATATTQPMSSQLQHDFQAWSRQQDRREGGGTQATQTRDALTKLERMGAPSDPQQLQEYYSAQSDLLESIMRSHRQNATNLQTHGMEPALMDIFGPLQLGRTVSTLEVPSAHSLLAPGSSRGGGGADLEPYMPQWQSESVPAELPNHVVDRLLMSGNHHPRHNISKHSRSNSLSGSKRSWSGMPSIPDDRELPSNGRGSTPDSPDVDHLEELARTADLEVAHRAFLVPPHKKRGKGGRQPAADPRLDPNIDERKAKRILANRLSAARSKMKQKNQMDVLSGIIDQLEHHNKELHEDVSELMEVCEGIEFTNRAMVRDCHILEEYIRRGREASAGRA